MNIVELVRSKVSSFPGISDIVHIDFTDSASESFGLSSTGDKILKSSVCGGELRQHTFVFYSLFQSLNDYDRLNNSGTLLDLQYYLERISPEDFDDGRLQKITCANGMIYSVPNGTENDAVMYQMQITAEYKTESEDIL